MPAWLDFKAYGIDIPYGRMTGKVKTVCPFCRDTRGNPKDKSLSVDLDKGVWLCHHCGAKGSLKKMREPWEDNNRWRGMVPARNKRERKTYAKPKPAPQTALEENALKWFASRGISEQTVAALKITEGEEYMPQTGRKMNTVQFNYYRGGELLNVKYRTGNKLFKMISGAELLPYNIDAIKGTPECIITEGEMDALSFYECGRHDVVSVPNGAGNNSEYLDDYLEGYFDDKQTIYIASDTDTKGKELRDELLRRFGADRCRVVTYGEGCKDANEHLQKYGRESLLKCLADAPETRVEGVFELADVEPGLDYIYERGLQRGKTVLFREFDALCSFETKRLCVVTGIPGCGKSEFIDQICERLNILHSWRVAYFSPENDPLEYHISKIIEKLTGKRFRAASLPADEYARAKQHVNSDFFFISPKDDFRLDTILGCGRYLVRRYGIKILVIDPYNYIEDESDGRNETRYISGQLSRMVKFAQQNDVLVILMAHPTKMPRDKSGEIRTPTLYDIAGSAHFANKADYGIAIQRANDDRVQVCVQKVRFKHLGHPGIATFWYNTLNGRYEPCAGAPPANADFNELENIERLYREYAVGGGSRTEKAADSGLSEAGLYDGANYFDEHHDTLPDSEVPF
ncbi:MAG: toprim domain-containing protein [Prevotella sp.]|nr:toprim domain-containing protein [Prevotella sp.]